MRGSTTPNNTEAVKMTDTTTKRSLQVKTDGGAGPYIELPFSQLNDVTRLLSRHQIRFWVDEDVISMRGGPEFAEINLERGADVRSVQAILDDAN